MRAFYNDIDAFCCSWVSNLMDSGLITPGVIDDTPIQNLDPAKFSGFNRVHFFCGIAGWDYALNLAGWGEREVFTGSCPCQPLSVAGQQRGHADERHLWPAFYNLIAERRPNVCFGEQVASKIGREWLSGVQADLEGANYACGSANICAAGVGAPHRRQRLYWVAMAYTEGERRERAGGSWPGWDGPADDDDSRVADAAGERRREGDENRGRLFGGDNTKGALGRFTEHDHPSDGFWSDAEWIACADGKARRAKRGIRLLVNGLQRGMGGSRVGRWRGYGNAIVPQVAAEFISAFLEAA